MNTRSKIRKTIRHVDMIINWDIILNGEEVNVLTFGIPSSVEATVYCFQILYRY